MTDWCGGDPAAWKGGETPEWDEREWEAGHPVFALYWWHEAYAAVWPEADWFAPRARWVSDR